MTPEATNDDLLVKAKTWLKANNMDYDLMVKLDEFMDILKLKQLSKALKVHIKNFNRPSRSKKTSLPAPTMGDNNP